VSMRSMAEPEICGWDAAYNFVLKQIRNIMNDKL